MNRWALAAVMVAALLVAGTCTAQNPPVAGAQQPSAPADSGTVPTAQETPAAEPAATSTAEKPFHVEAGGFYQHLDNEYSSWRGGDFRMMYSGGKVFKPFWSVSTQSRDEGSQQSYGFGSYIHFNKSFYVIGSISGAPEKKSLASPYYPKLRYDGMALYTVPGAKGLVLTAGYTEFQLAGGRGRIISGGAILYTKTVILSGAINFNENRPGSKKSKSGQMNFMHGRRGSYWVGGGVGGGKVAYQMLSAIPFDVRYDSILFNVFLQKWIGQNWGCILRYDFQDQREIYQRNGVTVSLFADF